MLLTERQLTRGPAYWLRQPVRWLLREALLGREKPRAGRSLHEGDGLDDALDDGQSRGRLRLFIKRNDDQC